MSLNWNITPVMYIDGDGYYPVHIFNNSSSLFRFKLISSFLIFRNPIIAFDYNGNHRNPNHGIPGSKSRIFYPDGSLKQERVYGPDGRPLKDHDYHDGEDIGFEHEHDWDWNKKPPRGPARAPDTSKIIGQVATTTVIVIGTYYLIKWGSAIILAPATGGGSLVIAGVTP